MTISSTTRENIWLIINISLVTWTWPSYSLSSKSKCMHSCLMLDICTAVPSKSRFFCSSLRWVELEITISYFMREQCSNRAESATEANVAQLARSSLSFHYRLAQMRLQGSPPAAFLFRLSIAHVDLISALAEILLLSCANCMLVNLLRSMRQIFQPMYRTCHVFLSNTKFNHFGIIEAKTVTVSSMAGRNCGTIE
jgi:hypothetical protein